MRAILIPVTVAVALAGASFQPAEAKGCIKGAVVGGLAGHAVHHGILGAAGGCIAGRHIANSHARREQQMQDQQSGYQGQQPGYQNNGGYQNNNGGYQNQ